MCACIRLPVEELHFLAVRQEDEQDADLFGVVLPPVPGRDAIGARAPGLQRRAPRRGKVRPEAGAVVVAPESGAPPPLLPTSVGFLESHPSNLL